MASGVQQGLLDLGPFEMPKGPSQQGPLDLGLFEKPKGPSQQGLLDLGLFKIAEPCARGGVLQSDLGIRSMCDRDRHHAIPEGALFPFSENRSQ